MGNWTFADVGRSLDANEAHELRTQFDEVTRATQAERMGDLQRVYTQGGLALVLGAGVSMDAGVPSWNQLLSNVLLAVIHRKLEPGNPLTDAYRPFTSVLERCLPTDPLVVARYAKLTFDRSKRGASFLDALRNELYQTTQQGVSPTLSSLANVIRRSPASGGVKQVITYNFDVLFEEALLAIDWRHHRPARDHRGVGDGVPVYHPHGVLHRPFAPEGKDDWTILAEDDYHAQFASPHSWSNIVQLNAFSQLRCLFVGLSMTDTNIRRLLSAARGADTPQHFVLLRRSSRAELTKRIAHEYFHPPHGHLGNLNQEHEDHVLDLACAGGDAATDLTLTALGVRVIWFDQFAQLPALIDSIGAGTAPSA